MSTPSVSSSSTLWATATKEWVVPKRPKPGRKPKGDPPPVKDDDEVDSKGRRVQNRAAQRAFRERKQSQLAELQSRLQSYEQGEIERNVALQNIARRLKEENEKLREENKLLKEKVAKLETARGTKAADKKRWRDESLAATSALDFDHPLKKSKLASRNKSGLHTFSNSYGSSTSSVSSPDSAGSSDSRFSPFPLSPQDPVSTSSLISALDTSNAKADSFSSTDVFPTFDCGFCTEDTPCLCREIALHQATTVRLQGGIHAPLKVENLDQNSSTIPVDRSLVLESPQPPVQISILDNLPAYQPPIPLRRRNITQVKSIFPVAPPPPVASSPAACSGDPENCMACADDSFGQAFCAAINESAAALPPCVDCPNSTNGPTQGSGAGTAQGVALGCPDGNNCDCYASSSVAIPPSCAATTTAPETMPTNDAWRQLKTHPNIAFTDLSLLADVVARRSKCTGPQVIISPAPGSVTPERVQSPAAVSATPATPKDADSDQLVLLTDPHAEYRQRERAISRGPSPPRLVPQDVLLRCGRERVREVRADAVREALRLLDARFSRG